VLLAGAGGGFDALCAVPVALALREAGHTVHFASYSFTNLSAVTAAQRVDKHPFLVRVTAQSRLTEGNYFPEQSLAKWWLQQFNESLTVWSYARVGVRPLANIFRYLQDVLHFDALVILDGGVDGLFIGNEFDLATPSMDAISVIAGSLVECQTKIHGFTAFGTEGAEGSVRHADALLRISELARDDAFIGVSAVTKSTTVGKQFLELLRFANAALPAEKHSVIAGSIVEAMRGAFGLTSFNVKTQTNAVWISPLTSLYWFFELDAVAQRKPFLREVVETDNVMDVANAFERAREKLGVLPRTDIPI
jgi:hypothetical protein